MNQFLRIIDRVLVILLLAGSLTIARAEPPPPTIVVKRDGVTLADGTPLAFGAWLTNSQKNIPLSLTSSDGSNITIGGISVTPTNFTVDPTSIQTVGSASVVLNVGYRPTSNTPDSGTLTIAYGAGQTRTISLSGEGGEPSIALKVGGVAVQNYDVENVRVDTEKEVTVAVQNSSKVPLSVSSIVITGSSYSISSSSITEVPAESSSNIKFKFRPTAKGSATGVLTILSNASNASSLSLNLTGRGTAPDLQVKINGVEVLSGSSYDFGYVAPNTDSELSFSVRNTGDDSLTLQPPVLPTSEFTSAFTSQTVVAAGAEYPFKIKFRASTKNDYSCNLSLSNDVTGKSPFTQTLTASTSIPARLEVLDSIQQPIQRGGFKRFGYVTVGGHLLQSFTLKNSGEKSLVVRSVQLTNNIGTAFTVDPVFPSGDTLITGGSSRDVEIRFAPSDNLPYEAELVIETNEPGNTAYRISLTGIGGEAPTGGPDPFGYTYQIIPSDANGLPASGVFNADLQAGNLPINIGFPFVFYDKTYTTCVACSNGMISFKPVGSLMSPVSLPNAAAETIIAPFWTDLRRTSLRYTTLGSTPNRVCIMEFSGDESTSPTTRNIKFQVSLYEGNNFIDFRYLAVTGGEAGSNSDASKIFEGTTKVSVGIGKDQVDGLLYRFDDAKSLAQKNDLVAPRIPFGVRFSRPVITSVQSNFVNPLNGQTVTIGGAENGLPELIRNVGKEVQDAYGTSKTFEAPEYIYYNRSFNRLASIDDGRLGWGGDGVAWYRLRNMGHSVDGQTVQGTETLFTTTLYNDATIVWQWDIEFAGIIDQAGNPSSNANGLGRRWYRWGEQFAALIDNPLQGLSSSSGRKEIPISYTLYDRLGGPINPAPTPVNESALMSSAPFGMTAPVRLVWNWERFVKYTFDATLSGASPVQMPGMAFIRYNRLGDNQPVVEVSGMPNKEVWLPMGRPAKIGAYYRTVDRLSTVADFTSKPDGDLDNLSNSVADLKDENVDGRLARVVDVARVMMPTTLHWAYNPTIFRAELPIGRGLDSLSPDSQLVPDLAVGGSLRSSDSGPGTEITAIRAAADGSTMTSQPLRWDSLGKTLYPVQPGIYRINWPDANDPSKSYQIEVVTALPGDITTLLSARENDDGSRQTRSGSLNQYVFETRMADTAGFPGSPRSHYVHLYDPSSLRTPPTLLDQSAEDEWKFLEMPYSDPTTDGTASASTDGSPFSVRSSGRSVVLYNYRPNVGEVADGTSSKEMLAVRVIESSQLSPIQRSDSRHVLGARSIRLGSGSAAYQGALGVTSSAGGSSSNLALGGHFLTDFWLNPKDVRSGPAVILASCSTVSGSKKVTCSGAASLVEGTSVSGTNIPIGAKVASVSSDGSGFFISLAATGTASNVEVTASDKPASLFSAQGGDASVTLDPATRQITANFRGLKVSHPVPKGGGDWRHYAMHVFQLNYFGMRVTVLEFFADGVRGQQVVLSSWLNAPKADSAAGATVDSNSMMIGRNFDVASDVLMDQFRLFKLSEAAPDYLSGAELRHLRMSRNIAKNQGVWTAEGPLLSFSFESAPSAGLFANNIVGSTYSLGPVAMNGSSDSLAWRRSDLQEVATRISSTLDAAGFGGSGYILNQESNYNAALYNRRARVGSWGPVYPVNVSEVFSASRRLEIAYYENPYLTDPGAHPNVAWPYVAAQFNEVTYPLYGPHRNGAIYISSRIGSEGVDTQGLPQKVFDLSSYSDIGIYNQPERNLAGFNPNEEHALVAPSGRPALKVRNLGEDVANNPPLAAFALQDDLNTTTGNDYTSEPWVLVQMNHLETAEPEMAAYKVFKAREGSVGFPRPSPADIASTPGLSYDAGSTPDDTVLRLDPAKPYNFCYSFTYPVAAGDTVKPPYPLDRVIGNKIMLANSGGNDFSQRALWFDVNHTPWVVSGNGRFFCQYFYPMRGDFYMPNVAPGTSVAWLPDLVSGNRKFISTLPDPQKASDTAAGKVVYYSYWKSSYPKLKRGETLTYQGGESFNENPGSNGLPALVAMKAAEVVYDPATPSMAIGDGNVGSYSARIIRPLDRYQIPLSADAMAAAGFSPASPKILVVGSNWFFKDLSGSLQKRFFYDSLSGQLVLRGCLNGRDLGDPAISSGIEPVNLLEPNVLTNDELAVLKSIASGGGSTEFNLCVDKIFAKCLNPMLVREDVAPNFPSVTGLYLAGLKEAPTYTQRLGINRNLYAANTDLTEKRANIAVLAATYEAAAANWRIVDSLPWTWFRFLFGDGLVKEFVENLTISRNNLAEGTAAAARVEASISSMGFQISRLPSPAVSKYAPLDSFGVGAALVTNPNLFAESESQSRFITIAENNRMELNGAPVSLHIVEITPERYRGAVKVIEGQDAFSEKITLQHSADFGANTGNMYYEWWIRDAASLDLVATEIKADGTLKQVDSSGNTLWQEYLPMDRLANDNLNLQQKHFGLHSVVFEGRPDVVLADKLVLMRYRHKDESGWRMVPLGRLADMTMWRPGMPAPFQWAGAANSPQLQADGSLRYVPQLVMGWVKRVLDRINPYEARYTDFFGNESPASYTSQIQIAGSPFAGKVALNPDKNVIERTGLIELYETVLARARELSIDNSSNPASTAGINQALLLAATRLSVLYELLGREAYSDAIDNTITVRGDDKQGLASAASFTHAFQNMEPDLLHEGLALLRGSDFRKSYPVYNRLFWNYAKGLGEAAYNSTYNIYDANKDGFINEDDARLLFPQGHGDAWGHLLAATDKHYALLQAPTFSWKARPELYSLMQNVLEVDYLDEKTFARLAAAKARAGRDIVKETYRLNYTQNPSGQWQGYTDAADPARAWGVSEWAHRAGHAAYFDWLVANSLMPATAAGAVAGTPAENLDRIERSGAIDEVGELAGTFSQIQKNMDEANSGANPLGLASDAIAFDIDPNFTITSSAVEGKTHFEQIYQRAITAGNNAAEALAYACSVNNKLNDLGSDTDATIVDSLRQDLGYRDRLIAIFGRPYSGTIGAGKAYPSGYEGPDILFYQYLDKTKIDQIVPGIEAAPNFVTWQTLYDQSKLLQANEGLVKLYKDVFGQSNANSRLSGAFLAMRNDSQYRFEPANQPLTYQYNTASKYGFQSLGDWGNRLSYGRTQTALEGMLTAEIALDRALNEYNGLMNDTEGKLKVLQNQVAAFEVQNDIKNSVFATKTSINTTIMALENGLAIFNMVKGVVVPTAKTIQEALPRSLGFSNDVTSIGRGAAAGLAAFAQMSSDIKTDVVNVVKSVAEFTRDQTVDTLELREWKAEQIAGIEGTVEGLTNYLGSEQTKRDDIGIAAQELEARRQEYITSVSDGMSLLGEREAFNKVLAAKAQKGRYKDMVLRLTRNEAMSKYQDAYDMAARYAWLAAKAYDYETGLDAGSPAAATQLFDKIVKTRQIGLWTSGEPRIGKGGLAEMLAQLKGNFDVLKGQIGLNNLQVANEGMSLRSELFRIGSGSAASDDRWKDALNVSKVDDLWGVPEFRQQCRSFADPSTGAQPGLVIRFGSTIENGLNFFGRPLMAGDHAYSASQFATRIASAGVILKGYPLDKLAATPRAYLLPSGTDFCRVSTSSYPVTRQWQVRDAKIPIPFVINQSMMSSPGFIPSLDAVDGSFGDVRRHADFRMWHSGDLDATGGPPKDQNNQNQRLVARSVWNSQWVLIIPGAGMNSNAKSGIDTFTESVSDIKLYFKTYSHNGQ
jgi:hypothetical protein